MRFRAAHKIASYLMVGTAVGTLALADSTTLLPVALTTLVGTLSWFAEPESGLARLVARVDVGLRLMAILTLIFAGYLVWRSFPEPDLSPLLYFVLFLTGYKLLQRRANRDYMQLYVLSFLLVLSAAWLSQGAAFAIGFSAYVIVSTWALILFHLRREIEDNYLVKHAPASPTQRVTVARVLDSRRVVGPSFFWATAGVALAVLLGATLVFVIAPRIGFGFLTGGIRRQTNVVGFSDEVRLGQHGLISDQNKTVVLRVVIPRIDALKNDEQRELALAQLYFRGTVYDTYESGQWLRSRNNHTRTIIRDRNSFDGGRLTFVRGPEQQQQPSPRFTDLKSAERQEIQIVSLTHPVAFALDRPMAFEIPPPPVGSFISTRIDARWSGEAALNMVRMTPTGSSIPLSDFTGARYVAYSIDSLVSRGDPSLPAAADLPEGVGAPYLALPAGLSDRVRALARTIVAGETRPAAKARAVVNWLQRNKSYTTDLQRDPEIADPLEDFLIKQTAGHCEYFASAAAILLRLSGVPTRYVNGFLGGEWNDIGRHITVREDRAHSWIEAYLDGSGWTRVDATPPSLRTTRMSRLRQILDSIEIWWSAWVIDYNAARQITLARGLARKFGVGGGFATLRDLPKPSAKQVFGSLAGLCALVILVRAWRARRRGGRSKPRSAARREPAFRLYDRVLDAFARAGQRRDDAETPREFAVRAGRRFPDAVVPLVALTGWYEAIRYGDRPVAADTLATMSGHAVAIERVLKRAAAAPAEGSASDRRQAA